MKPVKQMELLESEVQMMEKPAKRVNIVSLRLVKESPLMYQTEPSVVLKTATNC